MIRYKDLNGKICANIARYPNAFTSETLALVHGWFDADTLVDVDEKIYYLDRIITVLSNRDKSVLLMRRP